MTFVLFDMADTRETHDEMRWDEKKPTRREKFKQNFVNNWNSQILEMFGKLERNKMIASLISLTIWFTAWRDGLFQPVSFLQKIYLRPNIIEEVNTDLSAQTFTKLVFFIPLCLWKGLSIRLQCQSDTAPTFFHSSGVKLKFGEPVQDESPRSIDLSRGFVHCWPIDRSSHQGKCGQ